MGVEAYFQFLYLYLPEKILKVLGSVKVKIACIFLLHFGFCRYITAIMKQTLNIVTPSFKSINTMAFSKFLFFGVLMFLCWHLPAQAQKPLYKKEIYFEFNKYEIRNEDKKTLSAVVRAIKAQKTPCYITITGHTDNVDNNRYNYTLGMQRAQAVANYLSQRGGDSTKMQLYSKGEDKAKTGEVVDSLRLFDRRVEILLFADKSPIIATNLSGDSVAKITFNVAMMDSATGEKLAGELLLFRVDKGGNTHLVKSYLNTDSFTDTIVYGQKYQVAYSAKGYRSKNVSYNFADSALVPNKTYTTHTQLRTLKVKRRVNFEKIYFYGNEARFLPTSGGELNRLLKLAKQPDVAAIEIVGHVNYPYYYNQNDSGFIRFNYELSYNRAKAVYNYLVDNGVKHSVISYKGVSNTEMKFPTTREEGEMQQNRRVEVLILEE